MMATVKYRDLMKRLKADGWEIVVIRGSHRQLKHPVKRGRVTVAGSPNDDIHPRTLKSISRQAGWED
jgi:predicted RNA binding protein YcfA (HicA-like mRNA interferase family)